MKLTGKESFFISPPTNGDTTATERVEVLPFVVAIDTREQRPFAFERVDVRGKPSKVYTATKTLKTGDYSIVGFENRVVVERKSKEDLFGSCIRGRERFERELARMSKLERACVMVECSMEDVQHGLDQSQIDPRSVLLTSISWAGRYKVTWFFCPSRDEAERATLDYLRFAWKDFVNCGKSKRKEKVQHDIVTAIPDGH